MQAQPRKRGVAQKFTAKLKRKRIDVAAENDFVVPDPSEHKAPPRKRVKAVASSDPVVDEPAGDVAAPGKRKRATKPKSPPKPRIEGPTSTIDRAQRAEDLRFRKQKNANKFAEFVNKNADYKKSVAINSAQDQALKQEMRKSISVLPPAISSGRGLDSEFVNKKTRSEYRDMHRGKIEATAGASQGRMEKDPNDPQIRIMHLAKYTKKIPIFPNVYTDLDNIITTPHVYPQVEADMDAGEFGILRIRWFSTASDANYEALAKDALARHKDATARRLRDRRWGSP